MAAKTAGLDSSKVRNCGGLLLSEDQREEESVGRSTRIFLRREVYVKTKTINADDSWL